MTSNADASKVVVVSISYPTLVSSPLSLEDSIEQAFGSHPQALGIIIVRDLPDVYRRTESPYSSMRTSLPTCQRRPKNVTPIPEAHIALDGRMERKS